MRNKPRRLKRHERLLIALLGIIGQLLISSLRFRVVNLERYLRFRDNGQPVIFAIWHSQLLLVVNHARVFGVSTLASPTRDGEIGARIGERFGVISVRGDERYGPLGALRKLTGILNAGGNVGLFPDGPSGPARQVKPGVLMLAQRSGCPIIPIGVHAAWKISFKGAWDHFIVPLPFSRVVIHMGQPVAVAANAGATEREKLARTVAAGMDASCANAARPGT